MIRPLSAVAFCAAVVWLTWDRAVDAVVRRAMRLGGIHLP